MSSHTRRSGTNYRPHIEYSYKVNGSTHQGDTWRFSHGRFASQGEAQRIVDQYVIGESVPVHYDPDDPSASVLQPGAEFSSYVLLMFGIALLGLGGFAGWRVVRTSQNTNRSAPEAPTE